MFNSRSINALDAFDEKEEEVESTVQFEPSIMVMLEAIPDPMIIIDQTGKIVAANSLAEKLFNYTNSQLLNRVVEDLMPERFRFQHARHREHYNTKPFVKPMTAGAITVNFYGFKSTNEEFPINISISPLTINEKVYTLVGMRDLTERCHYEQCLKEKIAEAAKQLAITNTTEQINKQQEEFINNICHEVRSQLNGTYGTIPMLVESMKCISIASNKYYKLADEIKPLFEEAEHYIEMIKICTDQQKTILDNVLTLSKLENDRVELNISSFELTETIKNTLKILVAQIKQKKLTLMLDIPKDPVWIKADPYQLSQIIINLVSNAVKFTNEGYITFTAAIEPTLDLLTENVIINFSVKDTGIGIFLHKINNVFERFVQADSRVGAKYGGSGLGLAISKKIVELMGGTIQVESHMGEGSAFSFSIKGSYLNEQELLEATQTKSLLNNSKIKVLSPNLSGKKILIVEDNQINATILGKQLNQVGCICCVASDGEKALGLYQQNRFDLICMDLEIPIINGLEVTRQIREKELVEDYHTPIIGISGYSSSSKKNSALQSGMDDYLVKPYTPKELFEKILDQIILKDDHHTSNVDIAAHPSSICALSLERRDAIQGTQQDKEKEKTFSPIYQNEQRKLIRPSFPLTVSSSFGSQSSANNVRPLVTNSPSFATQIPSSNVVDNEQLERAETRITRRNSNKCTIL
ncbi:MAG: response regulator [Gammaproteobacteria bacterium]